MRSQRVTQIYNHLAIFNFLFYRIPLPDTDWHEFDTKSLKRKLQESSSATSATAGNVKTSTSKRRPRHSIDAPISSGNRSDPDVNNRSRESSLPLAPQEEANSDNGFKHIGTDDNSTNVSDKDRNK